MTVMTRHRKGNFKDVGDRHLPLFDGAGHRSGRGRHGWPTKDRTTEGEPPEPSDKPRKRAWKTVGILHFPHDDEE